MHSIHFPYNLQVVAISERHMFVQFIGQAEVLIQLDSTNQWVYLMVCQLIF